MINHQDTKHTKNRFMFFMARRSGLLGGLGVLVVQSGRSGL
jgi:hypothetical protein